METFKARKLRLSIFFAAICISVMLAQSCDWSGTWDSNWGQMVFQQSGSILTGTYTHDEGQLQGTVSGNKFTGTWTEVPSRSPPHDAGDVELILSDDCNSISGNWRYGSTGDWSGSWTGTRISSAGPVGSGDLPDLIINDVSVPSGIEPGRTAEIQVTFTNQGKEAAGPFSLYGYAFPAQNYQYSLESEAFSVSGLAAGETRTETLRISVPTDAPSGQWDVKAAIDNSNYSGEGSVKENDENNNEKWAKGISGSSNSGKNTGRKAPCAADGADYSPRPATDPYYAGPSLVPGSYNIWYGKRTGSNIGIPDAWNKLGPTALDDGQFYVFDVTAANIDRANPQMVNPMLTNPTPGESVVWLKLSEKDPYVVCFEGPLGGGIQLAGSWKMNGHQTGFNDWEADLALNRDGTLQWTETKGANVGANRQGTWNFDGSTLTLAWVSPGGGQTAWVSQSVTKDSITSGTYTVETAPGGTWSAARAG